MPTAVKTVEVPTWSSTYDKETKKHTYTRLGTEAIEVYWDNGIFAISKPLAGSVYRTKYVITHLATGFTAYGFDKIATARKVIAEYSKTDKLVGCPSGYEHWGRIDTPEKLMLQVHWMRDVVKQIIGIS